MTKEYERGERYQTSKWGVVAIAATSNGMLTLWRTDRAALAPGGLLMVASEVLEADILHNAAVDTSDFGQLVERWNAAGIALEGFDPGVPAEAIKAAVPESDYGGGYNWEGVLSLMVDGKRELYVLQVDPSDGYRSMLAPVTAVNPELARYCTFQFRFGPVPVKAKYVTSGGDYSSGDDQFVTLTDADGHTWLEFGTSDVGDYYPTGQVHWQAKPRMRATEMSAEEAWLWCKSLRSEDLRDISARMDEEGVQTIRMTHTGETHLKIEK